MTGGVVLRSGGFFFEREHAHPEFALLTGHSQAKMAVLKSGAEWGGASVPGWTQHGVLDGFGLPS